MNNKTEKLKFFWHKNRKTDLKNSQNRKTENPKASLNLGSLRFQEGNFVHQYHSIHLRRKSVLAIANLDPQPNFLLYRVLIYMRDITTIVSFNTCCTIS